jgi:hypothetical protein
MFAQSKTTLPAASQWKKRANTESADQISDSAGRLAIA